MAMLDVYIVPTFTDHQGKKLTRKYLLDTQLTDDGSDMAAVLADVTATIVLLEVLTGAAVGPVMIEIDSGDSAIASGAFTDWRDYAFIRINDPLENGSNNLTVPMIDKTLYDYGPDGLYTGSVFLTALDLFLAKLAHPDDHSTIVRGAVQERKKKGGLSPI